jgi:hypothetical protein
MKKPPVLKKPLEFTSRCRIELSRYLCPSLINYCMDVFPNTHYGKAVRHEPNHSVNSPPLERALEIFPLGKYKVMHLEICHFGSWGKSIGTNCPQLCPE